MGILKALLITLLFVFLAFGIYLLLANLHEESINFETYISNSSENLTMNSAQFYSNMRFPDKEISYRLNINCSNKKKKDADLAFAILEEKTVLSFYQNTNNPDILITCSNISPKPEQEKFFVAGEGGPTKIINTSRYAVIKSGKLALYRPETCDSPQIAIHEILHVLGFNHNKNKQSIMYQVTNCRQKIDQSIINEINRLYSQPKLSDLVLETLSANKTGRYLNFEVTISNHGLKDSEKLTLNLIESNKKFKNFDIKKIEIGAKRKLKVENLRIPKNTKKITFEIETPEKEITKKNNIAEIHTIK